MRFGFGLRSMDTPYARGRPRLLAHSSRVQHRVSCWSMGCQRESRNRPLVEAGAEHRSWVHGARKPLVEGCKGLRSALCAMESRGEPQSPLVVQQRRHVANPGKQDRQQDGTRRDFRGGYAGDWKSPRKVGAVVPRTPCAHSVRMFPFLPLSLWGEELRKT